jgi:succinyl-diaminopimelate desuccinylase
VDVDRLLDRLDAAVRPHRLLDTAWELVRAPSPTGDTEAVTAVYAQMLREAGLRVVVENPLPNAPNVAAYLDGFRDGPTLQYDGHTDVVARAEERPDGTRRVVPLPHPEPTVRDGVLYGRGAADMKGGLAIMAEAARVLVETGFAFGGRLLLTAHGWHEAPFGHGQDVRELIRRGHVGNAALVAEGAPDSIAVAGRGMAIYTATLRRAGDVCHENAVPPATPHPLFAAGRLLQRIEHLRADLARCTHALLEPESIFVGQVHGGDFYNRFPTVAVITGTRRWHPERSFRDVQTELAGIAQEVARDARMDVDVQWQLVRDGYAVPTDSPIVRAARYAFRRVKGVDPDIGGYASVGDAATLAREGNCHALWFGPNAHGAHGDLESIAVSEMVERTRMFLAATVAYFREQAGG